MVTAGDDGTTRYTRYFAFDADGVYQVAALTCWSADDFKAFVPVVVEALDEVVVVAGE